MSLPDETSTKNGQRKDWQFSTQNVGPKRNYDRLGGGNENYPISIAQKFVPTAMIRQ